MRKIETLVPTSPAAGDQTLEPPNDGTGHTHSSPGVDQNSRNGNRVSKIVEATEAASAARLFPAQE